MGTRPAPWDRIGRAAGYSAALAMAPYAVIKVVWVLGALLGAVEATTPWIVLNLVTVAMAAVGIAVALALVRPWGLRVPGSLVLLGSWLGSGFLVSILPFAVVSTIRDVLDPVETAASPQWQGWLLQFSFLGMGVGLAIAVPAHLRRRWPEAFDGRLGDSPPTSPPWSVPLAVGIGVVQCLWAFGGTLGLDHPAAVTPDWRVLQATSGLWALAAAAATWLACRCRPARLPRWPVTVVTGIGSGSLFAWGGWRLLALLYAAVTPAQAPAPENPVVAAVSQLASVLAGAGLAWTLTRRRRTES